MALLVAARPPASSATGTSRARNLRSARWLHKRVDVDFNGWFMCLIPRQVLDEIGLSLPLFIKWDDSEFGLRAKAAGYPTVTFPGAAVWHVPWTDKNDALDWQAYFHHRNRFVAALLHSPYPRGGRMVRESLNHQITHLVSMQYSTVELRHKALEDVLAGPDAAARRRCRRSSPRSTRSASSSPTRSSQADPDAFPPVRRNKPPRKGKDDSEVPGRASLLDAGRAAAAAPAASRPRDLARSTPRPRSRRMDAKWYRLARYDSAIVSMPDGTSAALYQRDPEKFRDLMKRTLEIHRAASSASGRAWPRSTARRSATSPRRRPGRRPSGPGWRRDRARRIVPSSATHDGPRTGTPARGARREELEALPLAPPAATGLLEVFRRRYLLRLLVRSTIQARYQGTVLGWFWSYLQPAVRFCMFYFVFQVMIGRGAGMENFAIHLFARHGDGALLHRDLQRRHPLAGENRGLIIKLPDAPGDVPGRADAGGAAGTPCRCW